ncbi:hypothetical protein EPK97_13065 [Chengkuizengella sediminis]|nr:hypothetical protein [Chengkuizengella sediminis]
MDVDLSSIMELEKNLVQIASHEGNCPVRSGVVEKCGGFDNYYNHDLSSSEFTAQVFADIDPNKYYRITGSTAGSSLNANTLNDFKGYIDDYDEYFFDGMDTEEAIHEQEGKDFLWTLVGLAVFIAGWTTGPIGWVAACSQLVGMIGVLAGITNTSYATNQRLTFSKRTAEMLESARYTALSSTSKWENVDYDYVRGF